jgi:DNA-binding MarR family transcriptional regulator
VAKRTKPDQDDDETYRSVIETYKTMQQRVLELADKEGLTQPQFQALRALAKSGAMLMRDISDKMLVTPANVTGIIDRLEQKGFVGRRARQGDRRATIIELTPKGATVYARMATRYRNFVHQALSAFTMDEQRTLRELLEKLQLEMSRSTG